MRIAIGQLWQETNTLNPLPSTRADFEAFGVYRGAELIERMAETNEPGGMIQALRGWPERPDIVGLARFAAWPSGTLDTATLEWIMSELLDTLTNAGPVDAVLLALHGSLAAASCPDVEGRVLRAVRAAIGPAVPLVASLDLHANLTPAMVSAADALVAYHTVPHVDVFETGARAAAVLRRILVDGARPVSAWQKVPAVLPAERANTEAEAGFAVERKRRLQALERDPVVLSAGICTVQPWLDIPDLGSAVLVCTDNQPKLATQACAELARELWRTRHEYKAELVTVEHAVAQAHQLADGLTVLGDAGDATTAGAPGDSVWILRELLKYSWPRPALVAMIAPAVVDEAERLGSGQRFRSNSGGVRDHRFGTRITVDAIVERLFDARFVINGHLGKNLAIDMGRSAVLRQGNVHVIVTSRNGPHFAPELFRAAGFDPFAASVVVAKSPLGFRAAYESHARQIFTVRSPGCAPSDFWTYPFAAIPRPLWPWDEIEHWEPAPTLSAAPCLAREQER
ncbi:MAG: M81 family metallopeptidase [Gammaproteobacteria bacterium]